MPLTPLKASAANASSYISPPRCHCPLVSPPPPTAVMIRPKGISVSDIIFVATNGHGEPAAASGHIGSASSRQIDVSSRFHMLAVIGPVTALLAVPLPAALLWPIIK